MTSNITIFKNIKDTSTPFHRDVFSILTRIKNGKSKGLVKQIRAEKGKYERNELKKLLPAVCFSGTFTKRTDASIIKHSGLICLDFDGYKTKKSLREDKQKLSSDKYVFSVFISPSGLGLKALIKIPPIVDNHKSYFNSLEAYFNSDYFDKTCKNVSRVCYESFDPLINVNPNSSVWDNVEDKSYNEYEKYSDSATIPITDENKIVDILVQWWKKKYPMTEGQRNQNAYVLAMSFNDFGVNKSLAEYVLSGYSCKDFNEQEIKRTIDSAYANPQNFGSKYYEDEEKMTQIRHKVARGVSKKEITSQLNDIAMSERDIESVIARIDKENMNSSFWIKSEKGVIKIVHFLFKQFLEDNGFYKFCPQGSKNYVFVRVTNNLIDHTSEKEIKDFILDFLIGKDDMTIYNYFADNTRYFKEDFLTLLSSIDVYFIEDTKKTAYLYYRNCAVKITPSEIIPIDYLDLDGYVWKDHVIDRDFSICEVGDCTYQKFVGNICGNDKGRLESMESTLGYLMHGYKNLSYCPAVILNDELISDNPEGGTGKGLFMNGLQKMKKVVVIDGKSFAFESTFAYQLVSADTQILCFDDVKKHFDFERLFSVVTEGLTLEKKNKDAIKIPFSKSPKIAITTNYAIKGKGNSFERRKWELELHQYYHKNFTPLDEFGKLMFGDWDDDEWCQFDNYMVNCLQSFLTTGLVKSSFVNLRIRQLSAETCHEFIEWCGLISGHECNILLEPKAKIYKQQLYYDFIEENPDFAPKAKMTISRTKFYKWLISYCIYKEGLAPEEGRDPTGRWMRIISKHQVSENGILEF
tara:strand:+ start:8532 stop:10949 length:2418 start_codon:yes stop_codon:yes gene_type:complete